MNETLPKDPSRDSPDEPDADGATGKQQASDSRSRPVYDGTSESTREMRDTSRRRRDAEEKLQQHLKQAKDHVPHQHEGQQGAEEDEDNDTG